MERVADIREKIYKYFHSSAACQNFFFDKAQEERYAAYRTTMYLLQDTTESLIAHREKGFSTDSFEAYIEFWGVMQAVFIQQDSIRELYEAVKCLELYTKDLVSWQSIRKLRNICAGHPAKKDRPKPVIRTFMGRNFGGYSSITYEQWSSQDGRSHPSFNLGEMLDNYAEEAKDILSTILESLKQQWP